MPGRSHLRRKRIAFASVAVVATLALLGPTAAGAQECLIGQLLCKSPTPTPSPSSSPKPKPQPKPKPSQSSSPRANTPPKGPAPTPYTGLRNAVGYVLDIAGTARNTRNLLALLARLQPAGVAPSQPELARGFGRFPVLGYVWYHDDYGAPRYEPYFHLHEGVDLFAAAHTPVIACVDGVIPKVANGSIGGISFWLAGDDGITYYYGHLQSFAPGLAPGKRVRVGEVLGYVGATGVAVGTYPHLHFEMHPGGGLPVSPKPVLDAWLNQAESSAIDAYERIVEYNALNRIGAARWQRVFDLLREPAAPVRPLWRLALGPAATSLGLDMALDAIAWGMDPAAASSGLTDETLTPQLASPLLTPNLLSPSGGGTLAGPALR